MRADLENFNYEKCFEEVMQEVKKPNILICGASQIGKSSLINDIFYRDGVEKAEVGTEGTSVTRGVKPYSSSKLNLYDSEGYETGEEKQKYYKEEIISIIDQRVEMYPDDMAQHIHEVWYCVSAGNKKFLDLDKELIRTILKKKIPLVVILTKVDCASESELASLKSIIQSEIPGVDVYTYSTELEKNDSLSEEEKQKYVQRDEVIQWSFLHLEESLRGGFLSAVKVGIKQKKRYVVSTIVPKYAALAAGTVVGASFIPVPFSDSVPLMSLQVKMVVDIFNAYGIEQTSRRFAMDLVGTQVISYLGKTLASQIWGMIPLIGNISKAVVNVSTAATITATLGMAITYLLELYLKECVNADGSCNISLTEFITPEKLKEAIIYIQKNDQETGEDAAYKISNIIETVVNSVKKGK